MYAWIRRVTPDLFLAAIVALLITLVLHQLEGRESERIAHETWEASESGLTFEEGMAVIGNSIRRSTRVHIPWLVALAGVAVGLACRNRRWAWLTTALAIIPALLMGASFYIDTPFPGAVLTCGYITLAVGAAFSATVVRSRFSPVALPHSD